MKYQIIRILSFLLLSIIVIPIAKAETMDETPFDLVSLAQDGYFEDQGIPKGELFIEEYRSGRVTAEGLVQATIKDKRLTEDTLRNRDYLSVVTRQIREQVNSDSDSN